MWHFIWSCLDMKWWEKMSFQHQRPGVLETWMGQIKEAIDSTEAEYCST